MYCASPSATLSTRPSFEPELEAATTATDSQALDADKVHTRKRSPEEARRTDPSRRVRGRRLLRSFRADEETRETEKKKEIAS